MLGQVETEVYEYHPQWKLKCINHNETNSAIFNRGFHIQNMQDSVLLGILMNVSELDGERQTMDTNTKVYTETERGFQDTRSATDRHQQKNH